MTCGRHLVRVLLVGLVPAMALLGDATSQDGKGKEDALIAGMKFVKVPRGTFWMGWDNAKKMSKQVEIGQDFELAAYAVTQEQWHTVTGSNPSWFSRRGMGKDQVKDVTDADLNRFPVEQVSWDDVQAFLKKLNEREKGKGWTYRLPRETEWEYACRAAATSKEDCSFDFYVAKGTNDLSGNQANFHGEFPGGNGKKGEFLNRPTMVGQYPPNRLGLYDMHGNVWQWCEDLYPDKGSFRVFRGGSWRIVGQFCRAAAHGGRALSSRSNGLGVRLGRVPSALAEKAPK